MSSSGPDFLRASLKDGGPLAFIVSAADARGVDFIELVAENPAKASQWLECLSKADNIDERGRAHIALGLGQLGYPSSMSALERLLEDPASSVQGAAAAALKLVERAPATTHSYSARGRILAAVGRKKRQQRSRACFDAFMELISASSAWQGQQAREEHRKQAQASFHAFWDLLSAVSEWTLRQAKQDQERAQACFNGLVDLVSATTVWTMQQTREDKQRAHACFDTLLELLDAGREWQIRNDFNDLLEIAAREDWGSVVLRGETLLAKAGPDWREKDLFRYTGATCFTAMAYNAMLKDSSLGETAFNRMLELSHLSKDAGAELSQTVQERQEDMLFTKAFM